jgi:hypothetical protein
VGAYLHSRFGVAAATPNSVDNPSASSVSQPVRSVDLAIDHRGGTPVTHHDRSEHSAPRGPSLVAATTPSTDSVQRRCGVTGPAPLLPTTIAQEAGSASITSNV